MNMALAKIDFMIQESEPLSKQKAHSLYWLGRYAERVYMSLHLLRKYYDENIEADSSSAYESYCKQLYIPFDNQTPSNYIADLLYGKDISNSLLSGLTLANDNALVLRGELTSETLSYIQIAKYHMQSCEQSCETNITHLQLITDNLLAFWGSAEERILNSTIKDFLFVGKCIERLDMELRFNYKKERIVKTYFNMRKIAQKISRAFNEDVLEELDELIIEKALDRNSISNNTEILNLLCNVLKSNV